MTQSKKWKIYSREDTLDYILILIAIIVFIFYISIYDQDCENIRNSCCPCPNPMTDEEWLRLYEDINYNRYDKSLYIMNDSIYLFNTTNKSSSSGI